MNMPPDRPFFRSSTVSATWVAYSTSCHINDARMLTHGQFQATAYSQGTPLTSGQGEEMWTTVLMLFFARALFLLIRDLIW